MKTLAALGLLFAVANAHAAKPDPMTMRLGTAGKRAGNEAARRAKKMGLPASVVARIETVARAGAPRAEAILAAGNASYWGARLFRTPEILSVDGTAGTYRTHVDPVFVFFGGSEAHDVYSGRPAPAVDHVRVGADHAEVSYPGGVTRTFDRIGRPTATVALPAGSLLVNSQGPRTVRTFAMRPDGSRVALTAQQHQAVRAELAQR